VNGGGGSLREWKGGGAFGPGGGGGVVGGKHFGLREGGEVGMEGDGRSRDG